MNGQKEKIESELRELWADYGGIGNEILDAACAIQRDGEVSDETIESVDCLILKSLDIAERLQSALGRDERYALRT